MKLTPTLIDQTIAQFQAVALPETHMAHQKLEEIFGDHTFLLNDKVCTSWSLWPMAVPAKSAGS